MNMFTVVTTIAAVVAVVGGYYLGVFSGRWQDVAVATFVAVSAVVVSYLCGASIFASAALAFCFVGATTFGTMSTNRILPTDSIAWASPRIFQMAVTADVVAIVFVFVRQFSH
jgi:hypothetical protein